MIIDNFLQMKTYLPAITIKADITALDDMKNIAEQELVDEILSEELYQLILQDKTEHKTLAIQCERIISLNAFLKAIPDMDLVLTQSGFAVHNSEAMAPHQQQG